MSSKYRIMLSEPIPKESLARVLDAVHRKYAHLTLESWIADKSDGIELVGCRLRPLTAFSRIYETKAISIRSDSLGTACDGLFEEFCRFCDQSKFPGTSIKWRTSQTTAMPKRDGTIWHCDFSFAAGLARDGYWAKLSLSSDSRLWTDTDQRRELFREAIRLWDLGERLKIESRGNDFVVIADPPLKLRHLFNREGNLNPTDFRVSGLPTLEKAINAARAARDGVSAQVLEAVVGIYPNRERYEETRDYFNASHLGWHIEAFGTISQEAEDILNGGEITDASPTWIPAFRWYEPSDTGKVYGSVIIENGQRYLEIATDGGMVELLQDRVAFLEDLHFEPVFI